MRDSHEVGEIGGCAAIKCASQQVCAMLQPDDAQNGLLSANFAGIVKQVSSYQTSQRLPRLPCLGSSHDKAKPEFTIATVLPGDLLLSRDPPTGDTSIRSHSRFTKPKTGSEDDSPNCSRNSCPDSDGRASEGCRQTQLRILSGG